MKTFFQKLYVSQEQQFTFHAQNKEEFLIWKSSFRQALQKQLGIDRLKELAGGAPRGNALLLESSQKEGYQCRKYVLETLPDVFMPFYMLIPDALSHTGCGSDTDGIIPNSAEKSRTVKEHVAKEHAVKEYAAKEYAAKVRAMITIPAHGANKNTVCGIAETEEEERKIREAPAECYGQIFARKGYVVFCPDPPGYGERTEPLSGEDLCFCPDKKRASTDSSCKDLAQTAEALSLSLTGLEIWELQRLLDFACSCPELSPVQSLPDFSNQTEVINAPLIGCAGFSGGGQYSMWLAAMDERIQLSVVSGYVHGYFDSLLACHLCPCNYAPGLWNLGDISDICSLIAPRPLFVENGTDDIENGPEGIAGPIRQVTKIRKAYALFHCENMPVHHTPPGPHRWYGGCYDFVDRYL